MSNNLKCPFCGEHDTRVADSRPGGEGSYIRRRRECKECGRRFTSHERVEIVRFSVIKKNNHREPFNSRKVITSLIKSSAGSMSMSAVHDLCDVIVAEIHEIYEREVSSQVIGRIVLEKLKSINEVAYVRYASVFQDFEDAEQFLGFLQTIK